ncbi:cysteine-rich receptor-like protein kinase 26 [Pyrus communis]|uniref:cysteine-rich receptor-like protein kinase 26 n=1 Tax=Pyrus communis TaxID=23211 RepID=UPI0035C268AC
MDFSRPLLLFILPAIFNLLAPTMAQFDLRTCTSAAEYCWICSDTGGNYTPGDIYQSNLKRLFSSFSSDTRNKSGFYSSSMGQDSNKVNAIALCRGDLALDNCRTCVNETTHLLLQNCPNHKEAILWGERCMVRYSYNLIFGIEQGDPTKYLPSPNSAKNSQQFEAVLNPLLGILIEKAASGDSLKKFAAGHANIPDAETIHAFAQCTPDINQQNCSNCLKDSFSIIPGCCGGKSGGRVLKPSCSLRYENNGDFFGPFTTSQIDIPVPPALAPAPAAKKSNTREIVIIITVVSVAVAIIMISICIFLRMMKRRVKLREGHGNSDENLVESLQYDFETIKSATDDFSDANKLGRGGFGTVYKGRLLNGQLIAVKRLSKNSEQGDREFKNEVELLAQLQHRNLVRLLGFCIKAKERLLIYQYVANASLDHFIFDPQNNAHLEWETRYKIIQGIARGILYLHEDSRVRIIHRDLKASNILLDEDMNPKIADFGMARLFMIDQTQGDTKTIVGTYGYMAPEYAIHGRFSVKTDIFSFGVLVLEIISAKKIGSFRYGKSEEDLLIYAWRNWREETPQNIIDPTLTTSSRIEIMRCIHVGLLCVQQNAVDRPTVVSIVSMLNSESLTLSVPSQPAFYLQDAGEPDMCLTTLTESDESKSSSIYVTQNEPSNITEPYPR